MGGATTMPPPAAGESLDDLLRAIAEAGADADPRCLVCDGETLAVRRRSGVGALVCRSCGTTLEDELPDSRPAYRVVDEVAAAPTGRHLRVVA